ncbi:hypothetical protein AVEN_186157-1 [Araneus ventricosus]|uniref:Uncharacterized protein n=1 Tax=Araneus ventricosus TaxID=182803 RepID=A0A4Y2GH39_ARAVE|nr:hypothetical protein AVEN_186157-1 [Araneus ventricosus]
MTRDSSVFGCFAEARRLPALGGRLWMQPGPHVSCPIGLRARSARSGRELKVDLEDMASFLRGQFYHTNLKEPNTWYVTFGTKDMATFMILESVLRD